MVIFVVRNDWKILRIKVANYTWSKVKTFFTYMLNILLQIQFLSVHSFIFIRTYLTGAELERVPRNPWIFRNLRHLLSKRSKKGNLEPVKC